MIKLKRKYKKVSLLAYLFLFLDILPASSQIEPAWEHPSYKEIFELNLVLDATSQSPQIAYINGYKLALANLLQEEPNPSAVFSYLENSISIIKASALSSPYKEYYLNDIFLLQALMQLKSGNELKGLWMINQLYRRSITLVNDYEDFLPARKVYALMQIMIGSVPESYKWIFNLLGFEGSTKKGIQQLQLLSQSNLPVNNEGTVLYYLITNYLQPEFSGNDLALLEQQIKKHPNLLLFHFIAGLSSLKQHKSLIARKHFEVLKARTSFPVISYFLAETYLHESSFKISNKLYQEFIKNNKGENLIKDSYLKIFLIHYMEGNASEAEKYRVLGKLEGKTISEADKNAHKLLNSSLLPHPDLFRIRFLTDGGFYKQALDLIANLEEKNLSNQDRIELIYRRARAFHLTGQVENAVKNYLLSIANNDGRYFAPNAALQLGYIYEEQNKLDEAQRYLEKVLEYENYTYETSINTKARSAIKNLNNP